MINERVHDALNEQINTELTSSYTYLAMSAWCEREHFRGAAAWLRLQSKEEYGHAMKLFDFLLARNCRVVLQEMPQPKAEFESILQVFETALEQEVQVSKHIDRLYEMAFDEKAFATLVELQWFLTEQVEEERTARDIVTKLQMIKDDPAAQLDLDRELGQRGAE